MAKLSAEHHLALGAKREREAIERLGSLDPEVITHKVCSKCGETKPVSDFSTRREKRKCGLVYVFPEPRCKECRRVQHGEWEERKRAEGVDLAAYQRKIYANLPQSSHARRRERQREWTAAKRRQEGKPPRRFKKNHPEAGKRVPVGPLAAFLADRVKAGESKAQIAVATDIDERTIFAIMEGERKQVLFAVADRLFTGLGCQGEMQVLYPIKADEKLVGYHVLDPDGILEGVGS